MYMPGACAPPQTFQHLDLGGTVVSLGTQVGALLEQSDVEIRLGDYVDRGILWIVGTIGLV